MGTVLLVEDNPADRLLLRTILSRAGFEVHEVSYGLQARDKTAEVRPHVVVLDVNLPDIDGHEVCRQLRADPHLTGIPVLMLTVRDDERDILAGLEAGADDYIAKDAAPEIILARVRRLARYRQMAMVTVLNEQLVQIGRLLAGIIHEIRGPLSVIRGNAELMSITLGPEHEVHRWIDPIVRNCQLLQSRLEHLMTAVRSGPPVLQPVDVNFIVRESADLFLKGTDPSKQGVRIVTEFAASLSAVQADAGRIMQVILNLLSNAQDAIKAEKTGGEISVRTEPCAHDGKVGVRIEISDNGPGIPESSLGRIFEPFYSTKADGSGYGLYLASEIVREHGGVLSACNREEGGARFVVWLPVGTPETSGTE